MSHERSGLADLARILPVRFTQHRLRVAEEACEATEDCGLASCGAHFVEEGQAPKARAASSPQPLRVPMSEILSAVQTVVVGGCWYGQGL